MGRYSCDPETAYEAEVAQAEKEVPVCTYCNRPVAEDFYYELNDEVICAECLEQHFRKEVVVG